MVDKWHFFPRDETPGYREPAMVITPNGKVTGLPENDLRLIAAAGTAASKVADMGYDPIKAIRALPHIMRTFQGISTDYFLQQVIDRAAGKEGNDGNR